MSGEDGLHLTTDVLIIGGGMAACWAASAAAQAGAQVVLVDKGFVGIRGVTATGGPNHWWVAPDPDKRAAAVEERHVRSLGLAERNWMARILEETWRTLPQLAAYYPFDGNGKGGTFYSGVRGPEYMRALRHFAGDAGVTILDHHPALELLVHDDGSVAGAAGRHRRRWPSHPDGRRPPLFHTRCPAAQFQRLACRARQCLGRSAQNVAQHHQGAGLLGAIRAVAGAI